MNNRQIRSPGRAHPVPVARGPQSHAPVAMVQPVYPTAPHAALLIDFDNVTMGIRSDLAAELKSLLSSNIVQGKIAIQRAYADWRRYPQYVLPLTEASIDLIYAPAYGSARKNATDIRLAIDAMELVFTRPEIGTIILLSGDSDFSSLVIKLKEYGKYVIGVGIRESSSDLLVQNCDEYYSYNALAGLVKSGEESLTKWDPWELAGEAVLRMKRNGDVMRADRLKQVMQEIDSSFDEGNLGMAKFSKFVAEAAQRGLLSMTKLENGQLEVDLPKGGTVAPAESGAAAAARSAQPGPAAPSVERERPSTRDRGGRSRRDRGRGRRDGAREAPRVERDDSEQLAFGTQPQPAPSAAAAAPPAEPQAAAPQATAAAQPTGERLTRSEALDLIRRSIDALAEAPGAAVPAARIRAKARDLLGRESETLAERHFLRILQDAHDADVIDLRRRGEDYEVARAAPVATVAEQLKRAPAAEPQKFAQPTLGARPASRAGRAGFGKKLGEAPPNLLSVGVVSSRAPAPAAPADKAAPAAFTAGAPAAAATHAAPKKSEAEQPKKRAPRKRAVRGEQPKEAASDMIGGAGERQPAKKKRAKRAAARAATDDPAAG